jgi:GAF domain-containing protein
MWRFALRNNVQRLRNLLAAAPAANDPAMLRRLLDSAEAELTDLEAASVDRLVRHHEELCIYSQNAVDEMMRLLGAQFGNLQIRDVSSGKLVMVAQRNFRKPFLEHFATVDEGYGSACARCLATGKRVVIEDVENDPAFADHLATAREAGFRAVQSTAVHDDAGTLLAVISTHFHEPRSFTANDHAAMDRFAAFLALGLAPLLASHEAQMSEQAAASTADKRRQG